MVIFVEFRHDIKVCTTLRIYYKYSPKIEKATVNNSMLLLESICINMIFLTTALCLMLMNNIIVSYRPSTKKFDQPLNVLFDLLLTNFY